MYPWRHRISGWRREVRYRDSIMGGILGIARGAFIDRQRSGRRFTPACFSFSMKPVSRSFNRTLRTLRGGACFYFIRSDTAVAVPVEPQDERARLFDELLARDLAILIFVKIAEICVGQCGVGFADRFELGLVKISVMVAICRRK